MPVGVFRDVQRPTLEELMQSQIETAKQKGAGDLEKLLHAGETWVVG